MELLAIQSAVGALLSGIWLIFKTWWWLILPSLFYFPAKFFYLWWLRWQVWYKEIDWLLLEIIPPAEILKPFRAMEDIFSELWFVYDSPNWRERWCEGELTQGPFWFSVEIVSLEGKIHFYLRIQRGQQKSFEAIIHAHYPEAEFFEVEDYAKKVPQDIPNNDYDMYGEDFVFLKENSYPIKTYKFFEIRPEEIEEEKRLDPFSSLMEAMAKLKEGEQLWLQIVAAAISNNDIPWVTQGREIADKIARRQGKPKERSILGGALHTLFSGKPPFEEEKKEESIIPPEMKLTPGEREILSAVEEKISKLGFKTFIRSVYVHKKEAGFSPHGKIPRTYFLHFNTQNLNGIRFWGATRTKIHYFFRKRRLYAKKRAIFRKYVQRFPPKYPKMVGPGLMILNAEELATIFHFPMKAATLPPGVPRILAKKVGPPPGIPTE